MRFILANPLVATPAAASANRIRDHIPIRIIGEEAPEILARWAREKDLAHKARNFLRSILSHAKRIDLRDVQQGKYFRILARVEAYGVDVTDALIAHGFATTLHAQAHRTGH
ncbi:MAG TPA: thermonuclease family protein, partial [bacterium]|nr:thermonuclease family protein [bacterium]